MGFLEEKCRTLNLEMIRAENEPPTESESGVDQHCT